MPQMQTHTQIYLPVKSHNGLAIEDPSGPKPSKHYSRMAPQNMRQSRLPLETFFKSPKPSTIKKHARLSGVRRSRSKVGTPPYIRRRKEKAEQENKKIETGARKWCEFLEASGISPEEKGWDCRGLYEVYGTPTAWSKNMVKNGAIDDVESDSE